ncbi:Gfo/Idh/MocA family protein [Thermotoga sp. KOL6]|uniref:Gfo/Idh/MocA family protein n=1 Tax=Thermotoga sp. KOL6 TaxID=126741 RepID=UPI000CB91C79|nr:Gfo/Idh/MocA family oxidoreductase [Thermotoga sp. KOL6]PLV59054.1 oxidoreductase [Thermotoga sp. KOL6]
MKKIRLGIVGCGIAARTLHFPALKELSHLFEITAVTSRTRAHAEEFARMSGNPVVFDSYEELLDSGLVDAVDLAVPVDLNLPFIERALQKGVHVICEKPISTDVKTGKKIVALSRNSNKVVYIAENFRHASVFWKAKELIEAGKIGEVVYTSWQIWVGMDESNEYVRTDWRKEPKHVGGFLSDGGVHHAAALRLIFGEVEWVSAVAEDLSPHLGGMDFLSTLFEFENGIVGNYTVSYSLKGEDEFEVVGTKGKMFIFWDKIVLNDDVVAVPQEDSYQREFEDFYHVIVTGKPNNLGNPEEALKDLAFIEACVKSNGEKTFISEFLL